MRTIIALVLLLGMVSLFADEGMTETPPFTLDTTAPSFAWQTPAGGETYQSDQPITLHWETTESHPGAISLDWSEDNGDIWQAIFSGQTDNGSEPWSVPAANTQLAKLKLSMTDSYGNVGLGVSGLFTIQPGWEICYTPMFSMDMIAPTCSLSVPLGGEEWYIGDTHAIVWTATDNHFTDESIQLNWQHDGSDWTAIADPMGNTGSYDWTIPPQQTASARIELFVTDEFGNTCADSSATFSITYVPPEAPDGVDMNLQGYDAVITWQPVTENIYGTPITPDGYIVLYNEQIEENDDDYYFLGYAPGTTYTHHDVAMFRETMYYRVVAFKDYESRIQTLLAGLSAGTGTREILYRWSDVKDRIRNAMNQTIGRRER